MLFELNRPVTLLGAFELLSDRDLLEEEMENLENLLETPRRAAVYAHFANRFLTQPDEQLGGVRETIGNYLQYFLTPEVAEVFCTGESTFDFGAIDQGKIILTTMPQKFQTERRYVNTFLKLLYYNHALRRFDKSKADRAKDNLLILWADEAQRFMTASEDGTSDYNCVDVIREAGATVVAAAQSTTSLVPPLGNDKAKVLTLNLRNRLIFRAADEADAVQAADFLGKKRVVKRSWGLQRRQAQRQLLRNRGTQNQTAQTPQSPRPRVRPRPLRARLPPRDLAAAGIGRHSCEMVFVVETIALERHVRRDQRAVCCAPRAVVALSPSRRRPLHFANRALVTSGIRRGPQERHASVWRLSSSLRLRGFTHSVSPATPSAQAATSRPKRFLSFASGEAKCCQCNRTNSKLSMTSSRRRSTTPIIPCATWGGCRPRSFWSVQTAHSCSCRNHFPTMAQRTTSRPMPASCASRTQRHPSSWHSKHGPSSPRPAKSSMKPKRRPRLWIGAK